MNTPETHRWSNVNAQPSVAISWVASRMFMKKNKTAIGRTSGVLTWSSLPNQSSTLNDAYNKQIPVEKLKNSLCKF